ncbi:MAG: glycosyltransferase family 4 protein [Ruminococcaceae bacterium]|nr:glycosyltransferase family 4 protein [Oscillospiraceae bacterium]
MSYKIGLFNDSFPPTIDGVANAVKNYADIITEKHGKAVVVTPKYPNVTDDYPYEVKRYLSAKLTSKMPYRVGNPFSPLMVRKLRQENFDLLHVHCPFCSALLAHEITLLDKNAPPTVFTYHTKFDIDIDNFVRNRPINYLGKKLVLKGISYADEVWCVSKGSIESLRALGYRGDVIVMPNGTDFVKGLAEPKMLAEIDRMYLIEPDIPVLLFCGRMMWYKNVKIILDAMKKVADAGIAFKSIFVGDGPDRPAIEQYAKNIGVYDRSIFTGAIYDRDKVKAFFSRADLFMFPSTYDTSGLVVKEAASCYCPTILTKGSCAAEDVTDMHSGILCEENAEDFAAKLSLVLKDRQLLKKIGQGAAEEIYLSWEDSVGRAFKRYEYLIENKNKRP